MTAKPSFLVPRAWLLAAAALAALGSAVAQTATNDTSGIKEAEIAPAPLYAAMAGDRPTISLALSVEYPTVGAQYRNHDSYTPADEYIGYYNHEMCYEYNKSGGYFEIKRKGTIRSGEKGARCGGDKEFSGNFLNWASSSSIDIMRLALSGGHRVIDEEGITVLERAFLPNGTDPGKTDSSRCFFKLVGHFDVKTIKKSAGGGNYADAIPKDMVEARDDQGRHTDGSNTNTIYIASLGNQIHFGVHAMGGTNNNCTFGPYSYALGAGGKVNDFHYARKNAFFPTSEHDQCDNGATCEADDDGQRVWYGDGKEGHQWITGIVKGKFKCGGSIFDNANRHGDNGEVATPFNDTSKCYLEDEDANLSGNTPFFYARVKVCDDKDVRDYKDSTGADFGYCREYPSKKKKPVGVIQKYADNLRMAAFGYVMDHSSPHSSPDTARFGGVLRAPMKYVGPNTYSPSGRHLSSDNERKEWDTETGVFVENPENDTEFGVSGVINYLNRFGSSGVYKSQDPVGELYYEVLRYLQGMTPTPLAVNSLNDYRKDGFPVYTSWEGRDPFGADLGYSESADYTCVNNSVVVVGDINTHDANAYGDGYPRSKVRGYLTSPDVAKNVPDAVAWRDVVLAFETGATKSYKDGKGETRSTSNSGNASTVDAFPDGDHRPLSILSGLAYWAHTHDIRGADWTDGSGKGTAQSKVRPGLRLTTYTFDVNESNYEWKWCKRYGSCATSGMRGNQYWLAAKYGGFLTQPPSEGSTLYNTQGNPFKDNNGNASTLVWSDMVKEQGDNTDGKKNPEPRTYYMPSNARGTITAFDAIFGAQQPLSQRSIGGADSSGGLQGTSYQALFDGTTWGGDVLAERFRDSAGNATQGRAWSANDRLVRELARGKQRNIIMGERKGDNTTGAFSFTAADTPNDVKTALAAGGAKADDVIAWLRGDQSKEEKNGGAFRDRDYLIGDIINSGVKYVGPPSGAANLGTGFAEYVTAPAQARRTSAVYVGANDGMLHAFHAGSKRVETNGTVETVLEEPGTGSELFAYIPSWMKDDLYRLADPKYVHRMYVDATPVIGDANLKSTCTVSNTGSNDCDWRTVLVGGTGGGGKGVFALDVTDPTRFTKDSVLWEFTDADDPDMGYVLGQSRIVKLYTGDEEDNSTTPPTTRKVYRWFAMVPAGVNNYVGVDEQTPSGGNGNANIFLLALDKAATAPWVQNSNYWKIELPRIADIEANYPTGLLNLEAFTGLGSVTEYVYAGDLHGQLWALSFKGVPTSGWTAATLANKYVNGSTIAPLFVATNKDGDPQPITVAPTILEGSSNGVHFVSFGTGKYFEPDDSWRNQKDSFYTVYSNFNTPAAQLLSRGRGTGANPPIIPDRSYLREVKKDTTSSTADTTYFEATAPFYWGWIASSQDETTRSGWFHDFDEDAEREVADASWITQTSRLMFSTLTPGASSETGVCGTGGGTSKIYTFDMISGKGFRRVSTIGMLAQPLVFFDTPEETPADSTGRRLRISPVFSGQFGSEGSKAEKVETIVVPFGRLSWRRIDNFQELKRAGSSTGTGTN